MTAQVISTQQPIKYYLPLTLNQGKSSNWEPPWTLSFSLSTLTVFPFFLIHYVPFFWWMYVSLLHPFAPSSSLSSSSTLITRNNIISIMLINLIFIIFIGETMWLCCVWYVHLVFILLHIEIVSTRFLSICLLLIVFVPIIFHHHLHFLIPVEETLNPSDDVHHVDTENPCEHVFTQRGWKKNTQCWIIFDKV